MRTETSADGLPVGVKSDPRCLYDEKNTNNICSVIPSTKLDTAAIGENSKFSILGPKTFKYKNPFRFTFGKVH